MDERLRQLERQIQAGDTDAREKLRRARRRSAPPRVAINTYGGGVKGMTVAQLIATQLDYAMEMRVLDELLRDTHDALPAVTSLIWACRPITQPYGPNGVVAPRPTCPWPPKADA